MSDKWLTYPALAELWQISPEAARTRARRGQYQRRVGNDGQAEVLVDSSAPIRKPRPPRAGGQTRTPILSANPDAETPLTNTAKALEALEAHVATLKDQLAKTEALAADRGREVVAERERVADLTSQILKLSLELLETRKADIRPYTWWQWLWGDDRDSVSARARGGNG